MICNPISANLVNCTPDKSPVVNNGQCLASVMAHTGVCIDPTNANLVPVNNSCRNHQAPQGYRYVMNANGVCVLLNLRSNQIITASGYPAPSVTASGDVTATAGNFVAGVTTWIQNNKGLAAMIGLGVVWALNKK